MDNVTINIDDEVSVPQSRVEALIKEMPPIPGGGGSVDPSTFKVQSKNAVSSIAHQIIEPDQGYDYLTRVTIEPIPISRVVDADGATIITIGA